MQDFLFVFTVMDYRRFCKEKRRVLVLFGSWRSKVRRLLQGRSPKAAQCPLARGKECECSLLSPCKDIRDLLPSGLFNLNCLPASKHPRFHPLTAPGDRTATGVWGAATIQNRHFQSKGECLLLSGLSADVKSKAAFILRVSSSG